MNIKLLSAYHLLEKSLKPKAHYNPFSSLASIDGASLDQAQLQHCVETIASILYRTTPHTQLQTMEGIECALQEQTQKPVLPQLGMTLLQQHLQQRLSSPKSAVIVLADSGYGADSYPMMAQRLSA